MPDERVADYIRDVQRAIAACARLTISEHAEALEEIAALAQQELNAAREQLRRLRSGR